jgi:primosomal protein N''
MVELLGDFMNAIFASGLKGIKLPRDHGSEVNHPLPAWEDPSETKWEPEIWHSLADNRLRFGLLDLLLRFENLKKVKKKDVLTLSRYLGQRLARRIYVISPTLSFPLMMRKWNASTVTRIQNRKKLGLRDSTH